MLTRASGLAILLALLLPSRDEAEGLAEASLLLCCRNEGLCVSLCGDVAVSGEQLLVEMQYLD